MAKSFLYKLHSHRIKPSVEAWTDLQTLLQSGFLCNDRAVQLKSCMKLPWFTPPIGPTIGKPGFPVGLLHSVSLLTGYHSANVPPLQHLLPTPAHAFPQHEPPRPPHRKKSPTAFSQQRSPRDAASRQKSGFGFRVMVMVAGD